MGLNVSISKFVNFFLLTLLISVSTSLQAQIYFDIDNRFANGIRIIASGLEIGINGELLIEKGAALNTNVYGQSLC